jgi:hypothetical protein
MKKGNQFLQFITDKRFIIALYVCLALTATLQSLLLPPKYVKETGFSFPLYNNYLIFRQSFHHLVDHLDLYDEYPSEHWDFYKYTPTFSLLFGVMALLPDEIGLPIWHLVNMLILVAAVYLLPHFSLRQKGLILLLGCIEAMTSIQSEQSNGLLAGLFIMAFALCERRHFFWAVACLALAAFIKPFGLVGFVFFLFYPDKIKHAIYAFMWGIVLLILPILIITPTELINQYQSWLELLSLDHAMKYGYSVLGWLHTWFGMNPNKTVLTLIGAVLFMLPFIRWREYMSIHFRLLVLASLLIWVVIFNHMAESPTFVIAMFGASIWYFIRPRGVGDTILFITVFAFVSLSATDLVPKFLQREFFRPYVLKAVPCIVLWVRIAVEMLYTRESEQRESIANTVRS